jgi:predicted DNA-binding transcriptional regulator AlpA
MSRIRSNSQTDLTLAELAEKAQHRKSPVQVSLRDADIVIVAFPQREYERWRAFRKAARDLVTRPRKTAAAYRAENLRALRRYERKYGMSSAEFYRRFQAGELPEDEQDYFDWRVRYNAHLHMEGQVAHAQR